MDGAAIIHFPHAYIHKSSGTPGKDPALSLLDRCSSLEGVLSYYRSSPKVSQYLHSAAAICLLLNREAEAKEYMEEAKRSSPHANFLKWLEAREQAMWSNRVGAGF